MANIRSVNRRHKRAIAARHAHARLAPPTAPAAIKAAGRATAKMATEQAGS